MPLCLHRLCLLEANGYLCSHFAQVYGSIRIELKGIFGEKGAFIYVFSPFALVRRQRRSQDLFPGLVVGRENRGYFMVGECGRFFFTSCERRERTSERSERVSSATPRNE